MQGLISTAIFLHLSQWSLAVTVGPDTLAVQEQTFYFYGYDHVAKLKPNDHWKYKQSLPHTLQALVNLDWEIYHKVRGIIETNDTTRGNDAFSNSLQEYLEDFQDTSLQLVDGVKNGGKFMGKEMRILSENILTPFLTVRRFRNYIQPWLQDSKKGSHLTPLQDSIVQFICSVYNKKDGPFRLDFHYAMLSIVMPHFMLDLNAEDIAMGNIRGNSVDVRLKACHCFDIGVHGVASGMYPIGIEWLELTVKKITNGDNTMDLNFAKEWLEMAISKHDLCWDREPRSDGDLASVFFHKPLMKNETDVNERKWLKQVTCEDKKNLENVLSRTSGLPFHLHWSVCKGDVTQSEAEKSRLFCWYESQVHPFWKVGPLKAELHSSFPRGEIVQYYDLIHNDSFFDSIISNGSDGLLPSVLDGDTHVPLPKLYAASVATVTGSAVDRLKTLTAAVTGLRRTSMSDFQVVTYVPGGHACTHEDWRGFDEVQVRWRNRIATFMLGLEEADQGGETSFPMSLVKMKIVKGSAIFSYNLLESGLKDKFAPHGACPLLFGRKWLAVTDMSYQDQDHFVCSKDQEGRYEILVNGKSKYE